MAIYVREGDVVLVRGTVTLTGLGETKEVGLTVNGTPVYLKPDEIVKVDRRHYAIGDQVASKNHFGKILAINDPDKERIRQFFVVDPDGYAATILECDLLPPENPDAA
ncbi:hypothetical protein [Microvirga brassicacearum]|uniref:Uncharacterized protein n=1 Tax=Microvirga brassicacearum TaxID=2580413 RepID=A0A5N3PH03_9HYPH|nr:hypothetical protein [Microvirga brassicacearum]KAB0269022.1 hypothetical protein FEZ63_02635 [Microvirga brassicacearum]